MYKEFNEFLTLRIRGLTDLSDFVNSSVTSRSTRLKSSVNNVSAVKCVNCNGGHNLSKWEDFLAKSVEQRSAIVRQKKLCFNCLRPGHFTSKCKTSARCRHCGNTHHSVLHAVKNEAHSESVSPKIVSAVDTKSSTNDPNKTQTAVIADVQTVQSRAASAPNVLLATAWVELYTPEGRRFKVRALLDQGSTFTFISESLCQLMRTKRHRADL